MSFSFRRPGVRSVAAALSLIVTAGLVSACSSSNDSAATSTSAADSTTTTVAATDKTLTILVSNDDGVGAKGIDVLVTALKGMPNTQVIVSAPATNQSGSGGKTTPGELTATPTTMLSGVEATAVTGFPADSVNWALSGGVKEKPQLVASGINAGQNVGSFIDLSGTVGAARAAAAKGIPGLAVSAGIDDDAAFAAAAKLAVEWVEQHRGALLDGSMDTVPASVTNINVPVCSAGAVRGLLEVPASPEAPASLAAVDCSAPEPATKPVDDNSAIAAGWASLSNIGV